MPDKSEIAERAARFWSSFTLFFKVGPCLEIAVALATAAMRTESRRVLIETLTRVSGNELDLNVLIEHLILRKGMFHEENNTFGFSRSGGSGFDGGNGTFAGQRICAACGKSNRPAASSAGGAAWLGDCAVSVHEGPMKHAIADLRMLLDATNALRARLNGVIDEI